MTFMRNLCHWLLPCPWQDCAATWGCRCGKKKRKGATAKAEAHVNDLVHQQQQLAAQQQQTIMQAAQLSPEEQAHLAQTRALAAQQAPWLQQRSLMGSEDLFKQLGPLAQTYYGQIQQQLAAPPQIAYEDTYGQQFQLMKERIAQEMAKRGFAIGTGSSGLEFEQLGRSGIDLAIKSAQERITNRLLNLQLQGQARGEAGNLDEFAAGLGTEARGEYANFLAQQQTLGQGEADRPFRGAVAGVAGATPYYNNAFGLDTNLAGQQLARAYQRDAAIGQTLGLGGPILGAVGGRRYGGSVGGTAGLQQGNQALLAAINLLAGGVGKGATGLGATPSVGGSGGSYLDMARLLGSQAGTSNFRGGY